MNISVGEYPIFEQNEPKPSVESTVLISKENEKQFS